jgi:cytochrome c oxidase subunit II
MRHIGRRIAKEKAMRIVLGLFVIMTATFFSTSMPIPGSRAQSSENNGGLQVIEVTAKKYEFAPSPIRVKQGTRVQLKITATDHAHGFKIKAYPEGTHPTDSPGIIFSSAQSCERIEKHQTTTIEFVAKAAGTYPFKCCTFCGWRHRSMKGELIVEP